MAIHHSALTPISDFSPLSEVATMRQTDSAAHKLKPRLFHKSTHLWVHPSMNRTWHYIYTLYCTPDSIPLWKHVVSYIKVIYIVISKCVAVTEPQESYMVSKEPSKLCFTCCSNHSSLKDKWSHNEQSSPMGYQVKSGGITRELNKEPSLHWSSIYTTGSWSILQQYLSGP